MCRMKTTSNQRAQQPEFLVKAANFRRLDRGMSIRVVSYGIVILAIGYAIAAVAMPGAFDAIGVTLSTLTLFIAAIVMHFSQSHMRADRAQGAYAARIGLLVSSVLVTINAQHFILFAAGWIASGWLLADAIGHVKGWQQAADAKARARRVFVASDVALVAGLALLWRMSDVTRFDQIAGKVTAGPWLVAPLALILFAALTRCAVPPFHKWLMGSMTAPTPISALMHAGLVNAGGLLLLRIAPAFEVAPVIKTATVVIGAAGALFGTGVMLVRPDVKRALGGSTVAQMSFMIMTCGLGAYAAALWHLIAHGLFKSWAFLGAGSTVGRATPPVLKPWSPRLATGAIIVGLGIVVALSALTDLSIPVPVALALVTGVASLSMLMRADRARAGGVATMAALFVTTYLGGLAIVESLPGLPSGTAPFGWAGQLALLAVFAAAWLVQSAKLPLPSSLYVRMVNTGGPALLK